MYGSDCTCNLYSKLRGDIYTGITDITIGNDSDVVGRTPMTVGGFYSEIREDIISVVYNLKVN